MNIYCFFLTIPIGPPTLLSATFTNLSNNLYLVGGRSSSYNESIYCLNVEKWNWSKLPIFEYGYGI
jgi:hypothetical protein